MFNKDKYFVYDEFYKTWIHRTPLKCILNPILRKVQFWTDHPYVIYSDVEIEDNVPHFLGYGIGKIKIISNYTGPKKWDWIKKIFR